MINKLIKKDNIDRLKTKYGKAQNRQVLRKSSAHTMVNGVNLFITFDFTYLKFSLMRDFFHLLNHKYNHNNNNVHTGI